MNLLILNKNCDDTIYNYSSKFLNPLNKYCTITKFGSGYKHFNNNFDLNDIESFYEKKDKAMSKKKITDQILNKIRI